METCFQIVSCLLLGVGLSATCGFKVFVPAFAISIGAHAGFVELSPSFAWLGSWPAILLLGTATILEILAYYIPVVDNFMDSLELPAAAIAGTIIVASTMVADIAPLAKWSLAIIAGGGTAVAIKTATSTVRGASTVVTAGFGNWIVNTVETVCSLVCSLLSILSPLLGILLVLGIFILVCFLLHRHVVKVRANRKAVQPDCIQ